jgi:predicted transcriptional regulator
MTPPESDLEAAEQMPVVGSVMTRSPLSVPIDATVRVAEDMMIDNEVRHLPVTDSGALVGIVSDRDIAFSSNVSESDLADRLRVRDVCSLDVYSVPPDEPLDQVLSEMATRHLGSVVVTEHGKIGGVFTVTDACRYFAEYLRAHFRASQES